MLFYRLHVSLYFHPSSLRPHKHQPQVHLVHMNTSGSCVSPQTDEERQQALQAYTAQSFLGSPQHNTLSSSGSGASAHAFPSPTSSPEHRTNMKRGPRKKLNEKYRLKYLRLRKAARAMIFVSELWTHGKLWVFFVLSLTGCLRLLVWYCKHCLNLSIVNSLQFHFFYLSYSQDQFHCCNTFFFTGECSSLWRSRPFRREVPKS